MTLSIPNPNALAHSKKLTTFIHNEICQSPGQCITFARFMELALYTPDLGYYSTDAHKFGPTGDFTTAPEISPLFAQCVANQCRQILSIMSGDILEIGAGSGIFAKDLLKQLDQYHCMPDRYFIFEVSSELRTRQQQFLQLHCPDKVDRIIWLDALPTNFTGIIFANEVMDALPVHCFKKEHEWMERCVAWHNGFTWYLTEPSLNLKQALIALEKDIAFPTGYQSEINLLLPHWITALSHSLKQGLILLFDYGYGRREFYHPDRAQGTLQCFFRHHVHDDPFFYPGLQDITAHVDFTTVIENAIQSNLQCGGYTTQASFLLACGLLELTEKNNIMENYRANQAIKLLTLPSQMGELIKVMGLTKNWNDPLLGFSLHDRRRDL